MIENELQKLYAPSEAEPWLVENLNRLQDVLKEAKSYLQDAFENDVTSFLMHTAVNDSDGSTRFRDFLGLNDTNAFGKPVSNDVE